MIRKPKHIFYAIVLIFFLPTALFGQIDLTELNPPLSIQLPENPGSDTLNIDIDNDGNIDLTFGVRYYFTNTMSKESFIFYYSFYKCNSDLLISAKPLYQGDSVNNELLFVNFDFISGYSKEFGGSQGLWASNDPPVDYPAFLGFRFSDSGNNHFGWLKIQTNGKALTLYNYGLNPVPNQPITAGQIN